MTRAEYIASMHTALDVVLASTAALPQYPIDFGANMILAHEYWVDGMPKDALVDYVDALHGTGVTKIDLNIGLFPWYNRGVRRSSATIAKYDAIIQRIKDLKMHLTFNPQYLSTYHSMANFAAWSAAAPPVYEYVALRYQPDSFVVVHEPSVMATRLGEAVTANQWVTFAQTTAAAVRRQSPLTRIGAGCISTETAHFTAFAAMTELNFLSLDIYSIPALTTYTSMIIEAGVAGKPVIIAETWRSPFVPVAAASLEAGASQGVGDSDFMEIDIKWMQAITAYARVLNVESITPSWTQPFFTYTTPGDGDATNSAYTALVVQALRRGSKTPMLKAFEALVREYVVET